MDSSSSATRHTSDHGYLETEYASCPQGSELQAAARWGVRSVLGQRLGVAMWQRSRLWGDLAFSRLLEKLGRTGCPLPPFPPQQAAHVWALFHQLLWKQLSGNVKVSPVSDASLGKRGRGKSSLLRVGLWADSFIDLSVTALCCLLPQGRLRGCPTLSLQCL